MNKGTRRIYFSLFLTMFILVSSTLHAKDSAIIVFDASGSMWGQIKGKAKIKIAQDVMETLVKDWNEDIELGLIAYGHREKGNCDDIEVLLPVATVDNKKILKIINEISPMGKTPISQSLKQAAETLRYTEDSATVILISDGEETCNADPCAVSKELEEKGINFTTHVIGFDIKKNKKAREQLKCIAENTGGQFYEAEDAASLKKALVEVKQVVEKPVVISEATLIAMASDNPIKSATEWSIINLSTEAIQTLKSDSAELQVDLPEGKYEIFVSAGGSSGDGKITVSSEAGQKFTIEVGETKGNKPFDAPSTIAAGTLMKFDWNGPNAKGDMIFIMKIKTKDNKYYLSGEQRHKTKDGSPAVLTAPAKTGKYEIRYYSYANGAVLSRAKLEVTPAKVIIDIPDEVPAGEVFDVPWIGPDSTKDVIFIADSKMKNNRYYRSDKRGFYTKNGSTGELIAPAKPGGYEIRYYSYNNGDVLAKFPLKVVKSGVTFDVPRIASAGSVIEVKWTGPNAKGDRLFISKPDMDESKYYYGNRQSVLASKGSPATLTVPVKKGTYEIRYYSKGNGKVLAKRALIVR